VGMRHVTAVCVIKKGLSHVLSHRGYSNVRSTTQ